MTSGYDSVSSSVVLWGVSVRPGRSLSKEALLTSDLTVLVRDGIVEPFLPASPAAPSSFLPTSPHSGEELLSQPIVALTSSSSSSETVSAASWGVLQLQYALNVALPLAERLNVAVATADAANDAGFGGPRRHRVGKLYLSDGARCIVAVEKQHCPAIDSVAFGGKLRIVGCPSVRNGMLLLTPKDVVLLGGMVKALHATWERHTRLLAKRLEGLPEDLTANTSGGRSPPAQAPIAVDAGCLVVENRHVEAARQGPAVVPVDAALTDGARTSTTDAAYAEDGDRGLRFTGAGPSTAAASIAVWEAPATPPPVAAASTAVSSAVIHALQGVDSGGDSGFGREKQSLIVTASIAEVRSDLTVITSRNEFALEVLLLVTDVRSGDRRAVGGGELVVDLGHAWLSDLVGMSPEDYQDLLESSFSNNNPGALQHLNTVAERVGSTLESYGEGVFVLERANAGLASIPLGTEASAPPLWVVVREQRIVQR